MRNTNDKKQSKLNRKFALALTLGFVFTGLASGCRKYLDPRPDKTQVVTASSQDLQAILNNVTVMNRIYPGYGEAASDDYYISVADYNALTNANDKTLYNWQPAGLVQPAQWLSPYEVVDYANQVLDGLGTIKNIPADQSVQLKGAALYFRAYAFFQLATIFSKPYTAASAATDLGIPLRLTADFNTRSVRASNAATYGQVISDFKTSLQLLPKVSLFPSAPNKLTTYAALARTYLAMGQYTEAGLYADSCLALNPPLMDFNALSETAPNPISRFNKETIFYSMSNGSSLLSTAKCKVDSSLYKSYAATDLRKNIYYKSNNNESYAFKGNYDGVQGSTIFSGIATDEIYLIAAECAARAGNIGKAMDLLNGLLITRFKKRTFQPLQAADTQSALSLVLAERRKELVFRGTRWTDLKRLNLETGRQTTLIRNLGESVYQLQPGDLRYELLIPQSVITISGIPQNAR